jgi:hypothetical protein
VPAIWRKIFRLLVPISTLHRSRISAAPQPETADDGELSNSTDITIDVISEQR